MSKRLTLIIMAGAFLCLPLASAWADLLRLPTEVAYYDPSRAYNGVTVFGSTVNSRTIFMIDMDGRLMRKWTTNGTCNWAGAGRLESNGNISANTIPPVNPPGNPMNFSGAGACGQMEELDWNGNVVQKFYAWNSEFRQHHDYIKIFNKKLNAYTYLTMGWSVRTPADMTAAGAIKPGTANFFPDAIYEWLPTSSTSASLVWKWTFCEHLCQSVDPAKNNYYSDVYLAPQKWDANMVSTSRSGPVSDWQHLNSMGYNEDTGHLVFNSREYNEFYVVDHLGTFVNTANYQANFDAAASAAGDFVYRWGSPRNYNAKGFTIGGKTYSDQPGFNDNGSVQIWGAHGVHFIPKYAWGRDGEAHGAPMPGAGNFLIFDNRVTNDPPFGGPSQMMEINPYVNGWNGNYVTGPTYTWQHNAPYFNAPYIGTAFGNGYEHQSRQVVWKYRPKSTGGLMSAHISNTVRLPNGNTLIDPAETSHIMEVTRGATDSSEAAEGTSPEVVWEYNFPNTGQIGVLNNGGPSATFRAYRYGLDHPGLAPHLQMDPTTYIISLKAEETPGPGYGLTLSGRVPCRSIPCQY